MSPIGHDQGGSLHIGPIGHPPARPAARLVAPLRRMGALVLRHWYLISGSWPRVLDLAYWPTVQMLLWGLIQTFLASMEGPFARAFGTLLGAALLWDVFFRSHISFTIGFLEEVWSRNLGHLMVSPLRPREFLAALVMVSLTRTLAGLLIAAVFAILVFGFSIFGLGAAFLAFFLNLAMFGWAMGMFVSALILRFGMGAETLAWAIAVGFAPLCAVYYPIDVLPGWAGAIAHVLPPAYVFEGLRGILIEQTLFADLLVWATALNLLYLAASTAFFFAMLRSARERGMLLQLGE